MALEPEPGRGAFGVRAGTGCAAGTVCECRGGVAPLSQGVLTGREVQQGGATGVPRLHGDGAHPLGTVHIRPDPTAKHESVIILGGGGRAGRRLRRRYSSAR